MPVSGTPKLMRVSASENFTVALDSQGNAWAWGSNASGQLGNGTNTDSDVPVPVTMPAGVTFTAVAANAAGCCRGHVLAVDSTGKLWGWGADDFNDNGTGSATNVPQPNTAAPPGVSFKAVGAGADAGYAVASDGTPYGWGDNGQGELNFPAGVNFTTIAGGYDYAIGVDTNGNAWGWGNDFGYQLGTGGKGSGPVVMPSGVHFQSISVSHFGDGSGFTLAVGSDGQVYAWGADGSGQLGDGTTTNRSAPVRAHTPAGAMFTASAAGGQHSLALDSTGKVWSWGDNSQGQLGIGAGPGPNTPQPISQPGGVTFDGVAAGDYHSIATTTSGGGGGGGGGGNGSLPPLTTPPPAGSKVSIVPSSRECSEPCEGRFGATVLDPAGNPVRNAEVDFSIAHANGTPAPEVSNVGDFPEFPGGSNSRFQLTGSDGSTLPFVDIERTTTVAQYIVTASIKDSAGTTHTSSAAWHVHPTTIGTLSGVFQVPSAIIGRPLYSSGYTGDAASFAAAVFDAYGNQYKFGLPVIAEIKKGVDHGWHATATIGDLCPPQVNYSVFGCYWSDVFASDQNVSTDGAMFSVTNGGTAGSDEVELTAKDAHGVTYRADFQDESPELDFISPQMPLPQNTKNHIGIETGLNLVGAGVGCGVAAAVPGPGWLAALACFGIVAGGAANQISIFDPPDVVHYTQVALPRAMPRGAVSRPLLCRHRLADCARLVSLARQYGNRIADVSSFEEALAITANRYSGARSKHDFHAALGQQAVLYVYLKRMAAAIGRRTGAGRALAAALIRDHLDVRLSPARFRAALSALAKLNGVPGGVVKRLIHDGLAADRAGVAALVSRAASHVRGSPLTLSGILSASVPGLSSLSNQYRRITVYGVQALVGLLTGQHAITVRARTTLVNDLAGLEPPASCITGLRRAGNWRRLINDINRVSRGSAKALLADASQPLRGIASGSSVHIPGCKPSPVGR